MRVSNEALWHPEVRLPFSHPQTLRLDPGVESSSVVVAPLLISKFLIMNHISPLHPFPLTMSSSTSITHIPLLLVRIRIKKLQHRSYYY
jgi:hypothetical protein